MHIRGVRLVLHARWEGALPDAMSLALNALWVAQSRWAEEIDSVHAGIREIVCRRSGLSRGITNPALNRNMESEPEKRLMR